MKPVPLQTRWRRGIVEVPGRQGYSRRTIQEGSGMDALLVFGILVVFIIGCALGGYYGYLHYGVSGEIGMLAVMVPMVAVLFAFRGRL
jgi:hypothetical protein